MNYVLPKQRAHNSLMYQNTTYHIPKKRTNKMTGCDAFSDSSEEAYTSPKLSKTAIKQSIRTRSANAIKGDSPKKRIGHK